MKMELIEGSETSAIRTQTPGNYPKENILQVNIHSGDLILVGCYVLSTGKTLPTFWKVPDPVLVDPEGEAIMTFKIIRNIPKFTCQWGLIFRQACYFTEPLWEPHVSHFFNPFWCLT